MKIKGNGEKSNRAFLPLVVLPPNGLGNSLLDKKVLPGRNIISEKVLWMEKEAGFSQSGIKAFDKSMSQDLFSTYHVPSVIFYPVELQDRRLAFLHQWVYCLNSDMTPAGTMKR